MKYFSPSLDPQNKYLFQTLDSFHTTSENNIFLYLGEIYSTWRGNKSQGKKSSSK